MVAESAINKTEAKVEAATNASLAVLEGVFKKEIDALKATAKKAGVNVDECLGDDETRLVNLPSFFSTSFMKCDQGLVVQAVGYVDDAVQRVSQKIVT